MVIRMVSVKRMGAMSLGKILGFMYAIFGLIIGAFISLFSIGNMMYGGFGAASMFFGIGAIIAFPVFYGIMGFISGLLMALFYNLIAGWVGGLEVEVNVD
ncbi:hypothetical protein V7O66_08585 [Methanolobus sp. ZRKC3]|uniref:hypothetical protein n=1 Tax=Methanolobus sp. ZRKC3 TaxID=3125786 RepID=UPI00324BECF0